VHVHVATVSSLRFVLEMFRLMVFDVVLLSLYPLEKFYVDGNKLQFRVPAGLGVLNNLREYMHNEHERDNGVTGPVIFAECLYYSNSFFMMISAHVRLFILSQNMCF
jgi:hypothetical protein